MSGLDVVVAQGHGIVAHTGCNAGIDVFAFSIHKIVIVGGIVALKDVSGVEKQHIFAAAGLPETVHIALHRHEGVLLAGRGVGVVEKAAVNISRCYNLEFLFTGTKGLSGHKEKDRKEDSEILSVHIGFVLKK